MLAAANQMAAVARLGDGELIQQLTTLLSKERGVHVKVLVHLAEVDARGLYRERAFSSMFEYCVQALHMSEAEAYLRIRAARLGRQYPRIWPMLEAGELHLSGLKLLGPQLNESNADELLEAARGKSKREIELLLATRFQKPDVPSVIRKLPERAPSADRGMPLPLGSGPETLPPTAERAAATSTAASNSEARPGLQPPAPASARPTLAPLSPGRYKVQLTASQQLHDKLRQARQHTVRRTFDWLARKAMPRTRQVRRPIERTSAVAQGWAEPSEARGSAPRPAAV